MKEIDLGNYRKIRVWINDPVLFGPRGVAREVLVLPAVKKSMSVNFAAVEIYAALGGRFQYGLLGGQFLPSYSHQLSVTLAVSDIRTEVFDNSLLSTLLDVSRIGLPEEYIDAIKQGVRLAKQQMSLIAAGDFVVNQSVYSDIGSSPNIFKLLTIVLTRLLHSTTSDVTNDEVIKLFEDARAATES